MEDNRNLGSNNANLHQGNSRKLVYHVTNCGNINRESMVHQWLHNSESSGPFYLPAENCIPNIESGSSRSSTSGASFHLPTESAASSSRSSPSGEWFDLPTETYPPNVATGSSRHSSTVPSVYSPAESCLQIFTTTSNQASSSEPSVYLSTDLDSNNNYFHQEAIHKHVKYVPNYANTNAESMVHRSSNQTHSPLVPTLPQNAVPRASIPTAPLTNFPTTDPSGGVNPNNALHPASSSTAMESRPLTATVDGQQRAMPNPGNPTLENELKPLSAYKWSVHVMSPELRKEYEGVWSAPINISDAKKKQWIEAKITDMSTKIKSRKVHGSTSEVIEGAKDSWLARAKKRKEQLISQWSLQYDKVENKQLKSMVKPIMGTRSELQSSDQGDADLHELRLGNLVLH